MQTLRNPAESRGGAFGGIESLLFSNTFEQMLLSGLNDQPQ